LEKIPDETSEETEPEGPKEIPITPISIDNTFSMF